jgi:hypothetical protein
MSLGQGGVGLRQYTGAVAWKLSVISYTKAVVWATSATPLPMWDVEGSDMVPLPNMVADFRDRCRDDSGQVASGY